MPRRTYTGIGSRQTPPDILELMTRLARALENDDYLLRSGGADGADTAFETGVLEPSHKIIYLPWKGFNGRQDQPCFVWKYTEEHEKIAAEHHPKWQFLRHGVKKLHTRNVAQVLGDDCRSPSNGVVCWTPDGLASGGTGQALRIAEAFGVPVFNLYNQDTRRMFLDILEKKDGEVRQGEVPGVRLELLE